mgnify:FL=1
MIDHKHGTEAEIFLNYALSYAVLGLPVFPIYSINQKGYCTCGMGKDCESPGKHPETKNGLKDASADIEQIKKWWPKDAVLPNNIGIVTGGKSGLVVVDVDGDEGFEALGAGRVEDLKDESVPCVKTGRGFHYFFKSQIPVKTKPGFLYKVDIKAEGGYVVAPPSLHVSGRRYEWSSIQKNVFPDVPSWVLNGRSGSEKKPVIEIANKVISEGQRNDTLFKLACSLRAKDVSYDTALSALEAENQKRCNPMLSETEVNNIVNSAYKYEPTTVNSFNCTDVGNAKRLVSQHGDKIRRPFAWKKWLCWDGKTWSIDNNGQILRLAKDTVKHIYEEAGLISDESQRKAVAKWAVSSESEHRINAMVSLAESEESIPISPQELDINPYLLNCLNGTIDLKTGELKQHDSKDFITKIIPVEYCPEATCELWIGFLEKILNWNYDMINFLQRAIGYSLTGVTLEQCLFLLYGIGANGKSTLLNIVNFLLGDYAQTATFDTFLLKNQERSINNDIARMQGKRFVAAIEAEGERRLAEVLIKQLTGGDIVTARFLFSEFFDYKPQFKIWLACNHKPLVKGTDHAIWRRIKLIPFDVTIPEAERDKHLTEKLKAELPGILAWAVKGCLEWQREGLKTPDEVRNATNEYQGAMDTIGAFLGECCILTPEVKAKARDLYGVYREWCETGGEYALSQRSFGLRLTERGLERVKSSGNYWKGIGIKTEK